MNQSFEGVPEGAQSCIKDWTALALILSANVGLEKLLSSKSTRKGIYSLKGGSQVHYQQKDTHSLV
jgi:hypothetical protein